jgi:hypothetical protein
MSTLFALHKFRLDAFDAIQGSFWPSSAQRAPSTLTKIPCFVLKLSASQGMLVAL